MDDTDKVKILYEDCKLNGLKVLPPDVNASEYRFAPTDAKTIRYGLGGIKGSGQGAIEDILRAREERPFKGPVRFLRARRPRRQVNRRTMEALIRAGAFDSLNANRAQLLASVSIAMEAADQKAESANQVSLFDLMDDAGEAIAPS
ncbi:helix-hairpin-helix domain-containing protein [Cupriavidus basilensis]